VTLPASAISYAPFGDSVFIVEDVKGQGGKTFRGVRQQFVKLGGARGDQVAVITGVKPGEEVVTSGVFKLRPGAAVIINNAVQVTTAYVGANADLGRGFITAPLERVIAGADGIDFLESSSSQGISTITVHLKLNYDTNAALTQIQTKVAQVRNQLPPEAEAPI